MGAKTQLRNVETGEVLVPDLEIAATPWQRAVGLIGRARLAPGSALWLHPCNGIHTFGVRFTIDVLFLDAEKRVVRAVANVRPGRICGPVWKARSVLELPSGMLAKASPPLGTKFEIVTS